MRPPSDSEYAAALEARLDPSGVVTLSDSEPALSCADVKCCHASEEEERYSVEKRSSQVEPAAMGGDGGSAVVRSSSTL